MDTGIAAAVVLSTLAAAGLGVVIACVALILGFVALFLFWWRELHRPLRLARFRENPILEPRPEHWWESEAVFNPGAVSHEGRVHLFYRALGKDGISRVGYASSPDGIHFDERLPYPIYDQGPGFAVPRHVSYRTLSYNTDSYASGGGWGGVEDPRAVKIDDKIYMSFEIFENWQSMRLGVTSITHAQLDAREFKWQPYIPMSPEGERHKNWVFFPEKINGKFAILHALTPTVMIEYVDDLEELRDEPIHSNNQRSGRPGKWDAFIRGAAAPPLKTRFGWLLLYHGMDPVHSEVGYKVGAMLLDIHDPSKVLAHSNAPILEPKEWYENDWKAGVVYASGAVVFGNDLIVYYGGGDKRIAAARANLREFVYKLLSGEHAVLEPVAV